MKSIISQDKTVHLEPGELLFLEGDEGHEMYIIKRGQIQVLKREGSKMVQLASLGPGSVLGELSLLDSQPRSATARAINHTELVTIDQEHLDKTYSKIPSWLSSLIKILVTRLRETNQRKHLQDLIEATPLVLKLLTKYTQEKVIPFKELSENIWTIYGLSEVDLNKILKLFKLFNFIEISQAKDLSKAIEIIQDEALEQYFDFLAYQLKNQEHPWSKLTDTDLLKLQLLNDTAQKRGSKSKDKLQFNHQNLSVELETQGFDENFIQEELINTYQSLGFVEILEKEISTKHSHHNHNYYLIEPNHIQKVIRFQTRLDFFSTDLKTYFLQA